MITLFLLESIESPAAEGLKVSVINYRVRRSQRSKSEATNSVRPNKRNARPLVDLDRAFETSITLNREGSDRAVSGSPNSSSADVGSVELGGDVADERRRDRDDGVRERMN